MAKNVFHLAAPHGLGMAWIGKKAAERWDSHNNNQELQQNLSIAQEMEIQDKDALTIKMATGWECGADMEWRYEVPDFFWKQKVLNQAYSYGMATPFTQLVKDERLLTMYPELKSYKLFVKLLPQGATTLGYFDEANKTLVVAIINGDDNYDLESVLITRRNTSFSVSRALNEAQMCKRLAVGSTISGQVAKLRLVMRSAVGT